MTVPPAPLRRRPPSRRHCLGLAAALALLAACAGAAEEERESRGHDDRPPPTPEQVIAWEAAALQEVVAAIPGDGAAVCISFPPSDEHPQGTAAASLPRIRADRPLHAADDCPFPPYSGQGWEVSAVSGLYGPDSSRVSVVVVRGSEAQTHRCVVRPGPPGPQAVCTPQPPRS